MKTNFVSLAQTTTKLNQQPQKKNPLTSAIDSQRHHCFTNDPQLRLQPVSSSLLGVWTGSFPYSSTHPLWNKKCTGYCPESSPTLSEPITQLSLWVCVCLCVCVLGRRDSIRMFSSFCGTSDSWQRSVDLILRVFIMPHSSCRISWLCNKLVLLLPHGVQLAHLAPLQSDRAFSHKLLIHNPSEGNQCFKRCKIPVRPEAVRPLY